MTPTSLQWVLLLGGACILWVARQKLFTRSSLDNIPSPFPNRYTLFGDLRTFFGRHAWKLQTELLNSYSSVVRINGFLGAPMLYVYDPKALHHIVVKDQYVYEETPTWINFNRLLFGHGLLSSIGDEHKRQRKILNPVFNTTQLRTMTPTFYRVVHRLRDAIANEVKEGQKEINILKWVTRTALELVGQGGLGHSFDPLECDWENPFVEVIKSFVPTFGPFFVFMQALPLALRVASPSTWRSILDNLPFKFIRHCLIIVDAMDTTSRTILAQKKTLLSQGDAALERQVGEGKDIMSVLLKANMHASGEEKMSDQELLGHMSSLIFAAMETTSGALAHAIQMLSEHPDAQERLREELIAERSKSGKEFLDFDELMNLPYLEAVCRETLRLHSPVTRMLRESTADIVMPLSQPIRGNDGTMMDEILVPKGTGIIIGILACNRSRAIWGSDADEWKPERWLGPLPDSVVDARVPGIYSNLMTFLGGGRACIGYKFSQLEIKVVLSVLVEYFEFRPSDKQVYWNWSGIQFPTVGTASSELQVPMRVARVQSKT